MLGKLWGEGRLEDQPCRVGSLKTNLGHLGAASGIAGLMKVALSLHHRELFPMLNLNKVHAGIDLAASGLTAQTSLEKWPEKDGAPLAAITSTGLSGSNAHAVLQAMPEHDMPYFDYKNTSYLLPISAHTPEALQQATRNYAQFLAAPAHPTIHNLCASASITRSHRLYRSVFQGQTIAELSNQIEAALSTGSTFSQGHITMHTHTPLRVAFAADIETSENWATCCKHLLAEPAFFALISECDHILDEALSWSLMTYLDDAHQEQRLSEPAIKQIGNLVLVLGLARLWIQWGIVPEALITEDMVLAQAISNLAAQLPLKQVFVQLLQQRVPELQLESLDSSDIAPLLLPIFSCDNAEALHAMDCTLILELGTTNEQTPEKLQEIPWLTVLQSGEPKTYRAELLATLGYCYQHGAAVDWRQVYSAPFRMVNLPTYAWQRKRTWLDWLSVEEISTAPEEKYRTAVVETSSPVSATAEPATLRQQLAELAAGDRTAFLLSHFSTTIMQLLELESNPQLQREDTIFALGLDSVTITQLLNHLQQQLGCALPFTLLFNNQTLGTVIAELLSIIDRPATEKSMQIAHQPA
ncbi:hypothetical protein KDW_58150 [Dictyobacter vulcani]|uniref:Carrier domain-containing protein n=1 Tax=Dictyobacter vulcani TaxID=2607529 RepID=A0A5J4KVX6_9CHLR|nr:hypothetical protein KDW_58150 [Dictyobacter vulcani]